MRTGIFLAAILLAGCVKPSPADLPTKYPGTPTMQSAEDAMKGKL